jgi:hypothetical protein
MSKRSCVVQDAPREQSVYQERPGEDSVTTKIGHPCRHCVDLTSGANPRRTPHEYLFHEGRSSLSPTASRYTCLICNTELIFERMGLCAGWT